MKWHTHSAGQKAGPYSIDELRAKMASGELSGEIFVWREGYPAWKKIGEVPELAELFSSPASEPPPPDFVLDLPVLEDAPNGAPHSAAPTHAPHAAPTPTPKAAPTAAPVSAPKSSAAKPAKANQSSSDLSVFTEMPKVANEKTGVIDKGLLKNLKKEAKKAEKIGKKEDAIQTAQVASAQKAPRNFKKIAGAVIGIIILGGAAAAAVYMNQPKGFSLPPISDVEAPDYERLKSAVSQPIDQVGVHLEIAKSSDDIPHPSFYLATNLPDTTPVDITIKQIAGTSLETIPAPVIVHVQGFTNHLAKSEKITVPQGEYTLVVTGGPNMKTSFAAGKFFLGGVKDAAYEASLKAAVDKKRADRRDKANHEFVDLNQGLAQLDTFRSILQKLSDLAKQQPVNQKILNSFHDLEKSWDEAELNLAVRSEIWKPEVLEASVVYPQLLQAGRDIWKDQKAVNENFKKYFPATAAERAPLLASITDQNAKATQNFVLLKAEIEKTHPGDIQ